MSRAVLDLAPDGRSVAVPLRLVTGARAVGVRIQGEVQTVRGMWPSDQTIGLPWLAWTAPTPSIQIEGQIRARLRRLRGVVDVVSVGVARSGADLSISVVVRVADDTGTATIRVATASDATAPGAWYTLLTGVGPAPIVPPMVVII